MDSFEEKVASIIEAAELEGIVIDYKEAELLAALDTQEVKEFLCKLFD